MSCGEEVRTQIEDCSRRRKFWVGKNSNLQSASFLRVISLVKKIVSLSSFCGNGKQLLLWRSSQEINREGKQTKVLSMLLFQQNRESLAAFASGAFTNQSSRSRPINITCQALYSSFIRRRPKATRLQSLLFTCVNNNAI